MKFLSALVIFSGILAVQCVTNKMAPGKSNTHIGTTVLPSQNDPCAGIPNTVYNETSYKCYYPQCSKSKSKCPKQGEIQVSMKPGCVCAEGYAYLGETCVDKNDKNKCGSIDYYWTWPGTSSQRTLPNGQLQKIDVNDDGSIASISTMG